MRSPISYLGSTSPFRQTFCTDMPLTVPPGKCHLSKTDLLEMIGLPPTCCPAVQLSLLCSCVIPSSERPQQRPPRHLFLFLSPTNLTSTSDLHNCVAFCWSVQLAFVAHFFLQQTFQRPPSVDHCIRTSYATHFKTTTVAAATTTTTTTTTNDDDGGDGGDAGKRRRRTNERTTKRTNERTNERTNKQTNERTK